ncbi:hypothetical protein Csa_018889 [Cucumis sativus]|uniref:Uncharacterized protein n=1 Tax=Cucumis sativus TaxID=3659 RepID=A0A0A0KYT3_CUCSA|nr:hypothetical protein Csa_018889 [Cucumis sativus]
MEVSVSNGCAGVSKRLTSARGVLWGGQMSTTTMEANGRSCEWLAAEGFGGPLGWAVVVDDNGSKQSELWTASSIVFRCVGGFKWVFSNGGERFQRMGRGFQKIDFTRGVPLGWADVVDDNGSK